MKKSRLIFLLKLISFSLILGYLWFWRLQSLYPHLLAPAAMPFFQWVGVKKWLLSWVIDHFTNIVPYTALVLAMPGIFKKWKKTLVALVAGLIILAGFHILLSWSVYYFSEQYHFSRAFFRRTFPFFLINDALPLVLWILFYPEILSELSGLLKRRMRRGKSDFSRTRANSRGDADQGTPN
ncbi:membrane hypothetical protein [Candidatus Zixiibacteriota bacterium]|nr:membrane hypothetical protein [candidate division Zixibacteria bacterium]